MKARATKVVLMDEPDNHLHPRMASKVAQQLLTSSAQVVVISHSLYMIPSAHLEVVRRLCMREPHDHLFLYANAVVFVEGSNDAEELR